MKPTKTLRKQLFQLTGPIFVETFTNHVIGCNGYVYAESLFG